MTNGWPAPPPRELSYEEHVALLQRRMRGRRSWLPWRRRRAHDACVELIALRDLELHHKRRPTLPAPGPHDA